jgi:hypothetical protein
LFFVGCSIMRASVECTVVSMLSCLMLCAEGGGFSNFVDIFNVTAGIWSTAILSEARFQLAATSLPNFGIAIFAGGRGTHCHYCFSNCIWKILSCLIICAVDDFSLIMPPVFSKVVDIFNVTSGTWSTANLSEARQALAATSLPDAGSAFFAGGGSTCCDVYYVDLVL